MGYSISARFRTGAERDRMLAFLALQDWEALAATAPHAHETGPVGGEDLSYAPGGTVSRLIGFNASLLPYYAWMVAAWVATQSSFRVGGKAVVYHDDERLVVEATPTAARVGTSFQVDDRGIAWPATDERGVQGAINKLIGWGEDRNAQRQWLRKVDAAWQQVLNLNSDGGADAGRRAKRGRAA